jgi:hypothetical protein
MTAMWARSISGRLVPVSCRIFDRLGESSPSLPSLQLLRRRSKTVTAITVAMGGKRWRRWLALLGVTLLVALLTPGIARADIFTVDTTADAGAGSLRATIEAANAHLNPSSGPDEIHFALAGTPPFTIEPQLDLPFITDPVVIDGETQPGYSDRPLVEIRSPQVQAVNFIGLRLAIGGNTIRGLAIDGYSFGANLMIRPDDALPCDHCDDDNLIEDDYVGLDPNGLPGPAGGSVDVQIYGSSRNTIRDNRIAAVSAAMIWILPLFANGRVVYASDNVIEGNFIGTTTDGSALAPGFQGSGIELDRTVGTRIGGTGGGAPGGACTGSCNLIATSSPGVGISSSGDTGVIIEGNLIGTDITGTEALSVQTSGVSVEDSAHVQIKRNLISGHEVGLALDFNIGGSSDVAITGNYVGTDASGTKSLGNPFVTYGVIVGDPLPGEVTIGGGPLGSSCTDPCNLISGNTEAGLLLGLNGHLGLRVENSIVRGNFIGTDVDGQRVAGLGNGIGVGVTSSDNTIEENLIYSSAGDGVSVFGNANTIERNVIAYSTVAGVSVGSTPGWLPPCCSGNLIRSNQIFANGFGIDLLKPGGCGPFSCGKGPTPNDLGDGDGIDDGANELQNFPVITSALSGGGETTISYSLNSHPNTRYRLEFFANDACDDSGFGEGQTVIASTDITTDAGGNYSSAASFPTPFGAGPVVTATATDPANNTSEFSACLTLETGGRIVVKKQTLPSGSTQGFAFTASYAASGFSLSDGQSNGSGALAPGSYSVSETAVSGWDLTGASCDNGNSPGAITLAAGQTVTCTFVNTQRGLARVVKTVRGASPSGGQSFTFQLRQGASTTAAGTILAQLDATTGNGDIVNFTTKLVPGTTYALCEIVMPGWMTSLGPPFYVVYNPSGDNSTVCSDFTVQPGQTRTFAIDNKPPPGGLARTIGFWKNWASCASSTGKQKPLLDQTLAAAGAAGITIGTLILHAGDCLKAIRLLNKSTIDTAKKMASDPAFNLAAQLLAAELNVVAGAGTCPAAVSAINGAQTLLAAIHFNGITHDKLSAAQATQANSLATTLDRYNNDLLC